MWGGPTHDGGNMGGKLFVWHGPGSRGEQVGSRCGVSQSPNPEDLLPQPRASSVLHSLQISSACPRPNLQIMLLGGALQTQTLTDTLVILQGRTI